MYNTYDPTPDDFQQHWWISQYHYRRGGAQRGQHFNADTFFHSCRYYLLMLDINQNAPIPDIAQRPRTL